MRILPLLLLLAACDMDLFPDRLAAPPLEVDLTRRVTCNDHTAVAQAVVDARFQGMSLREQRLLVLPRDPDAQVHRNIIESVYATSRPRTPGDWAELRVTAAQAAGAFCVNRPGRALRGQVIR